MSRPTVARLISIAQAMVSGRLDLAPVCLAPLDAAPNGDVGLIEAYKRLGGYETRRDAKAFTARTDYWRPYRGVAKHLLWAWLFIDRARDAAPGQPETRPLRSYRAVIILSEESPRRLSKTAKERPSSVG
jgi:DNA-3-methyladenine glycosylase II